MMELFTLNLLNYQIFLPVIFQIILRYIDRRRLSLKECNTSDIVKSWSLCLQALNP
ncbi:hypothetical protein C1646_766359 [Rhizophagus diaphanus]|nr:hypothetical protein C1646_766359 [Rhizophagus diaphanus] [Rhizophagus sp. MUCL 43196]